MKLKRIISLTLSIVMICALFTGCKALDNLKENHAVYTNSAKKEIIYKENTYKILPMNENFHPLSYYNDFHTVAQKDVPILIAYMGIDTENLDVYCDDEILLNHTKGRYYARSDVYDKYEKLMENYRLEDYVFYNYFYNTKTGFYDVELKEIDEADLAAVELAESTGIQQELPDYAYYGESFNFIIADKTRLFSRDGLSIFYYDNKAYLHFAERGVSFIVSDDYTAKMLEIIRKYNQY